MSKRYSLSEFESKELLRSYGIKITKDAIVHSAEEAIEQSEIIGFPVVLKISGAEFSHKTELNGVKLNLGSESSIRNAVADLYETVDGQTTLLISEQVKSSREFIAGVTRNEEYGLVLAFGVGGIFTEIIKDVVFRLLPASREEIWSMFDELFHKELFGKFRGEPEVDLEKLADTLAALGECAMDREDILSIDINPLLIDDGVPVAVDALVELYE
ncbi:MAG: carboxylate--amine ligase [Acidimicrobiaceae bacterium]|nr:carboxylate--amine ligase [Acidimicrobiaceae bacterium]|tara:strand:- start:11589 stop:12233 length:645 start_codon:yes stop_codon:yes gene_type:complete